MAEVKRKRTPKEIPLFQKVESSDNQFVDGRNIRFTPINRDYSNVIIFSRTNEFIPMFHVISNEYNGDYYRTRHWDNMGVKFNDITSYFNNLKNTTLHGFIKDSFNYSNSVGGVISDTKHKVDVFLKDHNFKSFGYGYSGSLELFFQQFCNGGDVRLNTRTGYFVNSNFYSIYVIESSKIIPVLLFCTSTENYHYHKLNFLLNNKIDVKRSVIFVDRMIDSTSFRFKNLRMLYKKQIEPFLIEKGFNIHKVPNEFMVENCMIKEITPPINIIERKKFISEIVKDFKRSL
jgi:hypothetical protein